MNNEPATFSISCIKPTEEVLSVVVTQTDENNFSACFSVNTNIKDITEPVLHKIGQEVAIAIGYNNNNTPVFKGTIVSVELKVNPMLGCVYTYTCKSHNVNQHPITGSNETLTPVLGDDVLDSCLSKNDQETTGYVKMLGNTLARCGYTINFDNIQPYFGSATISRVEHTIEDGFWKTTVYAGKEYLS